MKPLKSLAHWRRHSKVFAHTTNTSHSSIPSMVGQRKDRCSLRMLMIHTATMSSINICMDQVRASIKSINTMYQWSYECNHSVYLLSIELDLLVSPVFEEGSRIKSVYLPPDNWVHLWSGKAWHLRGDSGKMIHVDAPLGRPPVFYREESEWKEVFLRVNESQLRAGYGPRYNDLTPVFSQVTFGHYQNPRDYLGHCCGATHFSFST